MQTEPDPDTFQVDLEEVSFVGEGLVRPECVLTTAAGDILTADWRGGVARIRADGTQELIGGNERIGGAPVKPNGIALRQDGSFLLADLGDERGGVWRLSQDGDLAPFLLEVDGEPVGPANFVLVDHQDRVWITVSTRLRPRALDYRPTASSGFIALVDERGARVVADGLGYTNECRLDAGGEWLYVNETFGRRLSRFRVGSDGSLSARETVAEFGAGTFPDGLAFDVEGGIWITSIVSNRVIRLSPDGRRSVVLEDSDAGHVEEAERAFQAGEMGRPHVDRVRSRRLRNISCLTFGGRDLRTAFLGCLLGDGLATFRTPVAGLPPVHWDWGV